MGVGGDLGEKYMVRLGYNVLVGNNSSSNVDSIYKYFWLKQVHPNIQAFA